MFNRNNYSNPSGSNPPQRDGYSRPPQGYPPQHGAPDVGYGNHPLQFAMQRIQLMFIVDKGDTDRHRRNDDPRQVVVAARLYKLRWAVGKLRARGFCRLKKARTKSANLGTCEFG
jgi:hypothetical protein